MIQLLPAQRRQVILDLVGSREYATIAEIQAVTGASASTIHRDLARLSDAGAVLRLHGGARRAAAPPDPVLGLRRRLDHLPRALDRGDLATVRRLLTEALLACDQLTRKPAARPAP